ncbi:MAG TPA: transposase [Candidatus Saccharimonadales bacterium]|nr:transposase [Candidatus Saccharimonadales bacterium]
MPEQLFYHIYNRGVDKRPVFIQHGDYMRLFSLFDRYLGLEQRHSDENFVYPHFADAVSLLSFCLMPNHFHLLLQATEPAHISKFMQSLKTAYCRFFNEKYGRSGVLFESRYHRRLITHEADYLQMSRYIHLNALAITPDYDQYPYSSLQFYLYKSPPAWLTTGPVLDYFDNPEAYKAFHDAHVRQLASTALAYTN